MLNNNYFIKNKININKKREKTMEEKIKEILKIINNNLKIFINKKKHNKKTTYKIPNKEDDLYLVIGTEDGYFYKVDMEEYEKAKERLEAEKEGMYKYEE